ncbi:MAG: PDZ domain-containing protein, partial [Deltaproteobacteria bacterium]
DGYGPSDQTPFYAAGVPVLHFFTGAHSDYHKPSDDAGRINAAGTAQIAGLVADLVDTLSRRAEPLTYRRAPAPAPRGDVRSYGASLGTIPDYAGAPDGAPGVVLAGVRAGGPADRAGLRRGDRIVRIGDYDIANIHDLMHVLQQARPGQTTTVIVVRGDRKLTLRVTYGQRSRPAR